MGEESLRVKDQLDCVEKSSWIVFSDTKVSDKNG